MKRIIFLLLFLLFSCDNIFKKDKEDSNTETPLLVDYFSYNVSSQVAFYFFDSIIVSGNLIEDNDWVAAFKGDVCVGSKQWVCTGNCELPIYGDHSLNELTEGYMLPGEAPTFKIYDTSDSTFYDAIPSEEVLWQEGDLNQIETLIAE